ncbi:MAG: hypothetical protein KAW87_01030, partial [Candidatus Cloacimonetes bacterium]|nr:hypothetical protein [Candidatus Cloacimonadota bacterium]
NEKVNSLADRIVTKNSVRLIVIINFLYTIILIFLKFFDKREKVYVFVKLIVFERVMKYIFCNL